MSNLPAKPLSNKTAWITGASRGIGLAVSRTLAERGVHVVLGARSIEDIEQVAESIRQNGGKADAIRLDVGDPKSCQDFANAAHEKAANPDILINNAGFGTFRPIQYFQDDEFESQFRVNVFGTYYMCKLAFPLMLELGGGEIVNVSSLAGESAAKKGTAYFASKHAVNGFTKSLMLEARESGIRVMLVCPGSVDTRFHMDAHPGAKEKDQSWMATPQDVADAIVHALEAPRNANVSRIDVRPSMFEAP